MNDHLAEQLADQMEMGARTVLIVGNGCETLRGLVKARQISCRFVLPPEFSTNAIKGMQPELSFYTAVRQQLAIPTSVVMLVFDRADELKDDQCAMLETILKDDPVDGTGPGFRYVWLISNQPEKLGARLSGSIASVVQERS